MIFFRSLIALIAWMMLHSVLSAADRPLASKPFPGTSSTWNGFVRHDFMVHDHPAIVVVPEKERPGRPWIWRGEFFGAFADADIALVRAGWHLVYLAVPDLFGSPTAIQRWEGFYEMLIRDHGFSPKAGLIGLSRGGLYCMNWAAAHPEKTLAVYLDNAVCDFKSWPGGQPKKLGTGVGAPAEWVKLLQAFHFADDAAAIAYPHNPVDHLAPLAKAQIPLMLVYGDADKVVPHAENSALVYERYRQLKGPVERIVKPGQDHHPHGLKDVTPVVQFFEAAFATSTTALDLTPPRIIRENIEWLDVWVPGHEIKGQPRVLLIGDSITRGYYGGVENRLKGKAIISRLTTSKSVGDPGLLGEVALILSQSSFDVIHFNNGLHGWGYTEAEYAKALPDLVATIRKNAPNAKLVWAAITPMRVAGKLTDLRADNSRVIARNAIARKQMLAEKIPVNDLNTRIIDHPEWYSNDGVHLNAQGTDQLAEQVADAIQKQLSAVAR